MPSTTNKSVVLEYVEAFNDGNFQALRPLFTNDALIQGVTGSATLDLAIPFWEQLHKSLETKLEVIDLVEEGDSVVARFTERGRWMGPFMGSEYPTGRTYELPAIEWFTMAGGKIRRRLGVRDAAAQATQIGLNDHVNA